MHCHSVHYLAAAEARYHIRCYDEFRNIPVHADHIWMIGNEAMKLVVDEMYTN